MEVAIDIGFLEVGELLAYEGGFLGLAGYLGLEGFLHLLHHGMTSVGRLALQALQGSLRAQEV